MFRPSTTKRVVIILSIAIVAGCIAYAYALNDIKLRSRETSKTRSSMEYDRQTNSVLSSIQQVFKSTKISRDKLDRYILQSNGQFDLIKVLESIADESKVALNISENMPVSPVENTEAVEFLRVSILVSGNWQSVYRFWALFETLPYKTSLKKASLERTETISLVPTQSRIGLSSPEWRGSFETLILKTK